MVLQWQFGHVNFLLAHVDEKAVPFVFSCQAPWRASFRPLPLGLKFNMFTPRIYMEK